jgi:hypothetical protein
VKLACRLNRNDDKFFSLDCLLFYPRSLSVWDWFKAAERASHLLSKRCWHSLQPICEPAGVASPSLNRMARALVYGHIGIEGHRIACFLWDPRRSSCLWQLLSLRLRADVSAATLNVADAPLSELKMLTPHPIGRKPRTIAPLEHQIDFSQRWTRCPTASEYRCARHDGHHRARSCQVLCTR